MSENSKVQQQTSDNGRKGERRSSVLCRICQLSTLDGNPLISPCNCKGSVGAVHTSCLERWLIAASRSTCEICHYQYLATYTRRYTFLQSIRRWLQNSQRFQQFKADICNLTLLSIIMCLITIICLIRLETTALEGEKAGLSRHWTQGIMGAFLGTLFFCYGWAIAYIIRKQISPWYRWWRHTYNVHIQLVDNVANREGNDVPEDEHEVVVEVTTTMPPQRTTRTSDTAGNTEALPAANSNLAAAR